jgi:RimJ/RimL family protein N-acetyltransferase
VGEPGPVRQDRRHDRGDREYIGRGYGTDAMRVIVGYGFRELGLHRSALSVTEFNQAGIRAYEKAGFTVEGRRRESVLHDGRWYDNLLMSILDYEWAARRDQRGAGALTGSS